MDFQGYQDSSDFLFSALDCLGFGVSIFDHQGQFLFVNRYNLRVSGRSRQDFIGQSTNDFYDKGILSYPVAAEVVKTRCPKSMLQQAYTKDGKVKEYMVNATPIFDGDGNMKYIVAERIEIDQIFEKYTILKQTPYKMLKSSTSKQTSIISTSDEMNTVLNLAQRVSLSDSSVLLQGETGVGKEVVAHYIHKSSPRSEHPFVQINCGAMVESLLESELFGYEKGSFTGALSTGKKGLIESAHHGTIFLDEINSMPPSLQVKFLRVLETRQVQKIGSTKSKFVDFRLICATNENLNHCVREGRFREDLFYRVGVVPITIPPLRQRKSDIKCLADYFLNAFCEKYRKEKSLSDRIYHRMDEYEWPGNVRELRNFIEWTVVMTTSGSVHIEDIPEYMISNPIPEEKEVALEQAVSPPKPQNENTYPLRDEKETICEALEICRYHRQRTADYLGISRRSLQYKLKKYGLLEK